MPKVVTQQRRGRASNPRLLDRKSDALPLSHRVTPTHLFSFANVSETKLVNRPKLSVYVKILQKPGSQGRIYILHAQMPCKKIQAAGERPRTALGKLIALPDSSAGVRARCPMSAILIGLGDYSSHCLRHNLLVKYNSGLMKFQHFPTLCSPLLSVCIQIQAETTEFPSYTRKIIPG